MKHLFEISAQDKNWIKYLTGSGNSKSLLRPFQNSYCEFIRWAIRKKEGHTKAPLTAYKLEMPDINITLLQAAISMPAHGMGDVAVLQQKKGPCAYLTLHGESSKNWLDRGLADFYLPMETPEHDAKKAISDIISPWTEFFDNIVEQADKETDIIDKITEQLQAVDPVAFCQKYLLTIEEGFWQNPEHYDSELRENLFPASKQAPNKPQKLTP